MEDEVMTNEVVTDEMVEIIPDQTEKSTGLTKGQKATGIFVIVAAIYGVGSLIYKGVKWVIGKIKSHKAKKAEKEEVADAEVIEVSNEDMDKIQEEK